MNGFRVALFTLFVLFAGVATAGQDITYKEADKAPLTMGTVPYDLAPSWTGGPRAIPKQGYPRCHKGQMPLVVGTTDAAGGWTHTMQLLLDWQRANAMIAEGGSGKWARAVVTNLKGKAAVWCVPEPKGAADTPPVTTPRVALTENPERIVLKGDNTMKSLDSTASFGARATFGLELIGGDLVLATDLAFQFHQGWYLMEADLSVSWDNQDNTDRAIGWTVGIRPIGGWFGCVDVSLALRGGESSHALVDYGDELRLGAGVAIAFRPLWWLEQSWAREIIELRLEGLAAQIYHKGDDFSSADWAPWVRLGLGVKLGW